MQKRQREKTVTRNLCEEGLIICLVYLLKFGFEFFAENFQSPHFRKLARLTLSLACAFIIISTGDTVSMRNVLMVLPGYGVCVILARNGRKNEAKLPSGTFRNEPIRWNRLFAHIISQVIRRCLSEFNDHKAIKTMACSDF